MKNLLFTAVIFFAAIVNAQTKRNDTHNANDRYANIELQYATTTKLPEGTMLKGGKVMLKKGYKASYADNNQIIIVQKPNGNTTGAFSCRCKSGSGRCGASLSDGTLTCIALGGCDCILDIAVTPPKNAALTKDALQWKTLIVPTGKTEDPDQGGEIIKKKNSPIKKIK